MDTVSLAIKSTLNSISTFCKFLSANDTGKTGGHQAGIYISKPSVSILFDEPCCRGQNKEKRVRIQWQNDFFTDSRFIYYGQKTRNEYRITSFGRNFHLLNPEYTGALFVLSKIENDYYEAYILNSDSEIEDFLSAFSLTPAETNRLIDLSRTDSFLLEQLEIQSFINGLSVDFPTTEEMSKFVREIPLKDTSSSKGYSAISNPDKTLISWIDLEYKAYKSLEEKRYLDVVSKGFSSIGDFLSIAAQIMNRRKSRAGKSLEHHLAAIFDENRVQYTAQAVTEGNKRPDFLFPSEIAYHDFSFPSSKLTSLAAKTTCKDRWRQILNEADRLRDEKKYLCTLQQGISVTQMDEMEAEGVQLVVPKDYIKTYPKERREKIWTLDTFVKYVKKLQDS